MDRDELITLDGRTFFYADADGDVEAPEAKGYFYDDVRHVSRWTLRLNEEELQCLESSAVDYFSARIVLATKEEQPAITITRDRFVTDGFHEDLKVTNHANERKQFKLELTFDSDFADIAEARNGSSETKAGNRRHETEGRVSTLWFELDGFRRGTRVEFGRSCRLEANRVSFDLDLAPREEWSCCIDVEPIVDGERKRALRRCNSFRTPEPHMPISLDEWMETAPKLETDWVDLQTLYRQSLLDLAALRIRPDEQVKRAMPAGGMPWYMALFGRDSLWTALLALPFHASLAKATLETLAHHQATEYDDFRDAEPGKILHELRRGKLTALGVEPQSPYYGTHDATPLFLILLDEYERWTGDTELVRKLEPNARAALEWLEGPADLDGDGFIEYRSRSPKGLNNHCWKDSDDGILHADGTQPEKPLAVCELQAYAYDARLRTARLARNVWNDAELAQKLERDARALKQQFNRDFWDGRTRRYALALDREKKKVDPPASNMGHLLFSGIVYDDRAEQVVRRLLRDDLFSGWGIRSVSTEAKSYSPVRYHQGTVWPHDTAICAEGMRRYGFADEATRVTLALVEAGFAFENRLPECFAGFARDETNLTVEYPNALRPQAWAAAAALSCVRTFLGLDVVDGELRVRRHLPDKARRLELKGVSVRGRKVDA